jgi:hypothetical protein
MAMASAWPTCVRSWACVADSCCSRSVTACRPCWRFRNDWHAARVDRR